MLLLALIFLVATTHLLAEEAEAPLASAVLQPISASTVTTPAAGPAQLLCNPYKHMNKQNAMIKILNILTRLLLRRSAAYGEMVQEWLLLWQVFVLHPLVLVNLTLVVAVFFLLLSLEGAKRTSQPPHRVSSSSLS